jgi:beta-lactamase regulating signal transducer with metallopeptidase domain
MKALWDAGALLPELCRSLLQVGIGLTLQSTLLLGLGLLAGRALRRRGPALTSLIYQVSLAGTVLGALLSLGLGRHFPPLWSVSLPSAVGRPASSASWQAGPSVAPRGVAPFGETAVLDPFAASSEAPILGAASGNGPAAMLPAGNNGAAGSVASAMDRRGHSPRSAVRAGGGGIAWLYVTAVGVWSTGTLLLLFWLLLCQLHLNRLRRNSVPVGEGAGAALLADLCQSLRLHAPRLLASPQVQSPFLTGLWQPAILLPADYEQQFDGPTLRAILAHELVHLSRGDCAWNLLARLACAFGWVQPLLWALSRRLVQTSEEVCDQEVVHREGNPRAYAHCLFTLSEQLRSSRAERALGVGVMPFRSSLGQRIQHILDSSRERPLAPSSRLRALVALGAAPVVILGLFLVSAVAAPPDASAPRNAVEGTEEPQRPVLENIRGLEKPVTYTETKIPLGELVQKVAAETGVRLVAMPEVADEPVAVVVKDLPARELLQQVADLLDYRWSRRGKAGEWRYEIWQDLASKQREEALRAQAWGDVEKRFQEEVRRQVEAPALSPAEIERRLDEEEERLQKMAQFTSGEQRDAFLNSPQERERSRRIQDALRQSSPISQALTRFVGRLTPRQWAVLRQGEPLRFSTDPQPGELPLPEDLAQTLRTSQPTEYPPGRRIYPNHPEIDEEIRQRETRTQEQWASATGYRVGIQLGPVPNQYRTWGPSLHLSVGAEPLRSGAPPEAAGLRHFEMPHHGIGVGIGPAVVQQWAEENTPERAAALAKDPLLGSRKLFKPTVKPRPTPDWGPNAIRIWRLSELLPEVARTYGVNLIADAYWTAPAISVPQLSTGVPTSLYKLLDRMAGPRYRWQRHGPLLRLRSRNWFFDRPREIPLRLVRRWKALVEQHGALPLEEYLQSVVALSDNQLESLGLLREAAAFPEELSGLGGAYRARHALRLYASLTAAQRQALWQGNALPVAQMLPAQQALYRDAVRELTRHQSAAPDLRQWASASLVLRGVPFVRIQERRGAGASERMELVTLSAGGRAAVVPSSSARGQVLELPPAEAAAAARDVAASAGSAALPAPASGSGRPTAGAAPGPETRSPCLNLLFRWEYAPTARSFSMVMIAAPS